MTTVAPDETAPDNQAELVEGHAAEHAHPSDWQYIKIAILLAVLTALEVFTYFQSVHNLGRDALIAGLMVMMIVKISLVVAWFMHLKFDDKTFRWLFTSGVLLALGVYTVMLTTFLIWD
jgi:cytochrome c oxidase subunit 4